MLLTSLVESLFVLPNHLSHLPGPERRPSNVLDRACAWPQAQVDRGLKRFVEGPLDRGLGVATRHPAIVIAAGLGALVLSVALVPAGIVRVNFGQEVEGDIATANLRMPEGTTARRTHEVARELEAAGRRALDRLSRGRPEDAAPLLTGVVLTVGLPQRMAEGATREGRGHRRRQGTFSPDLPDVADHLPRLYAPLARNGATDPVSDPVRRIHRLRRRHRHRHADAGRACADHRDLQVAPSRPPRRAA